jgi:predicted ribosome quality control (RQC) complex YloA/Tae2 family protein
MELNAFDIFNLVNESQFLVSGKLDNVYQKDAKDLYLQIYIKDKPKQLLRINAGKYFYLISKRPNFDENIQRLCSFLRKYVVNSRIKSFEQIGCERIIKLVLENKESTYELFVEFFGKGNIVVVKDKKIIAVAEEQIWKDRTVKPGEVYVYPNKEDSKDVFEKYKQKGSVVTMQSLDKEMSVFAEKSSPKNKEIAKIENIIEKQTESLAKLMNESELNKKKGELIYENYQQLTEILIKIKEMKGEPWDKIKKELKKYKFFKDVNEKEGILMVEI